MVHGAEYQGRLHVHLDRFSLGAQNGPKDGRQPNLSFNGNGHSVQHGAEDDYETAERLEPEYPGVTTACLAPDRCLKTVAVRTSM